MYFNVYNDTGALALHKDGWALFKDLCVLIKLVGNSFLGFGADPGYKIEFNVSDILIQEGIARTCYNHQVLARFYDGESVTIILRDSRYS